MVVSIATVSYTHLDVYKSKRPRCPPNNLGARQAFVHRLFGRIADQTPRVLHLVHLLVTSINARRASNALELKAVADIDTGRADLYADAAVDAVAQAFRARVGSFPPRPPRFAALPVIGDVQRIAVEHHELELRVRANVLAHVLAHETGVAIGGGAVEENPEYLPRAKRQLDDAVGQVANWREIADEGQASPQAVSYTHLDVYKRQGFDMVIVVHKQSVFGQLWPPISYCYHRSSVLKSMSRTVAVHAGAGRFASTHR